MSPWDGLKKKIASMAIATVEITTGAKNTIRKNAPPRMPALMIAASRKLPTDIRKKTSTATMMLWAKLLQNSWSPNNLT
jgi:hypothetical protein